MRSIPRRGAGADRFLDRICRIPDPLISLEDAWRCRHADLAALTDDALRRERRLALLRADLEAPPHPWLGSRIAAIDAELRQRQRPAEPGAPPPPPRQAAPPPAPPSRLHHRPTGVRQGGGRR